MIADRIRAIRDHLDMTRKGFGEKIYVSQDVINNLERGRVAPTENHIRAICEKFNVNEHWLRTGEGEMFNTANESLDALAEANNIDPITRAIVVGLMEMPAVHREPFINLIFKVSSMVTTGDYEQAKVEALAAETVFGTGLDTLTKNRPQDDDQEQPHTV